MLPPLLLSYITLLNRPKTSPGKTARNRMPVLFPSVYTAFTFLPSPYLLRNTASPHPEKEKIQEKAFPKMRMGLKRMRGTAAANESKGPRK